MTSVESFESLIRVWIFFPLNHNGIIVFKYYVNTFKFFDIEEYFLKTENLFLNVKF